MGHLTHGSRQPDHALDRYLREHYSAARGGLSLFERSARSQSDPLVRRALAQLAAHVAEDRAALLAILDETGVERSPVKERLFVWGERLGRLKPNGTVLRRSTLSDLLELEALATALQAKELGWRSLRRLADVDDRFNPYQLDLLVRRAQDQRSTVEELRLAEVVRVLGGSACAAGGAP